MTPLRSRPTVPSPTLVLVRPRPRAAAAPVPHGRAPRAQPTRSSAPVRIRLAPVRVGAQAVARRREIVQGCREVFLVVMATLALGLVSAAIEAGRMGPEQAGASGGATLFDPHREAPLKTNAR